MSNTKTTFSTPEVAAAIDLFKVVPVDIADATVGAGECFKRGFVVLTQSGNVTAITQQLFNIIDNYYGVDTIAINQTFHKSFKTVRDMDPWTYWVQQAVHYFSTYGLEYIGEKAKPYVPLEALHVPHSCMKAKNITVIRQVSVGEYREIVNKFVSTCVAPSNRVKMHFDHIADFITVHLDAFKSFELMTMYCDKMNLVPYRGDLALRYAIYRATGDTLVIKNKRTIELIKQMGESPVRANVCASILLNADRRELAKIFLRYKPLFLAFKGYPGCKPLINHLRRIADQYHQPLSDVSVLNFSKLVKEHRVADVRHVVAHASNRELVKLANFIGSTLNATNTTVPAVYNIRNGRSFVNTEVDRSHEFYNEYYDALVHITEVLCNRLDVENKVFVMDPCVDYAVPTSEKQFIGNIPWGTKILGLPSTAITTGIQWFNQQHTRVDLDLHLNSANRHFGWNAGYTDGSDIIYTGDMTDATNGAAEAYWFNPPVNEPFILSVNKFSGPEKVDYKMFMTAAKPVNGYGNYTFDPADALFAPIPLRFNGDHSQTIGLFNGPVFYFYGGSITNGIVPAGNYDDYVKGMVNRVTCMWTMSELLTQAGARIVTDISELTEDELEDLEVVDLTPTALTATTLLDIVDGE